MARAKKYPYKITLRLSEEGGAALEKTAGIMDLSPAEAGRVIVEHSVKGEPIKLSEGGKYVRNQKK
jgi:hypothetical protein